MVTDSLVPIIELYWTLFKTSILTATHKWIFLSLSLSDSYCTFSDSVVLSCSVRNLLRSLERIDGINFRISWFLFEHDLNSWFDAMAGSCKLFFFHWIVASRLRRFDASVGNLQIQDVGSIYVDAITRCKCNYI